MRLKISGEIRRLWISPAISASAHHVANSCGRSGTLVTQLEPSWSRFGPVLEDLYTPHRAVLMICVHPASMRAKTNHRTSSHCLPRFLSTLDTSDRLSPRAPASGWGRIESEWLTAHRIIILLSFIVHTVDNLGPVRPSTRQPGEHLPQNPSARGKLISRGML